MTESSDTGYDEDQPSIGEKLLALSLPGQPLCHFPLGDPREPDFSYCGAPQGQGTKDYCLDHFALMYQKVPVKRKEQDFRSFNGRKEMGRFRLAIVAMHGEGFAGGREGALPGQDRPREGEGGDAGR